MTAPTESPDDLGFDLPRPARISRPLIAAAAVIGVGAAFVLGYLPHRAAHERLASGETGASTAVTSGVVRVETIKANEVKSDHAFSLPGSVNPLEQTTIFPRVNGYVAKWTVDIGDRVKTNQLLAVIDTPETDADLAAARAQLAQAKAALAQAKSHAAFSKINADRYDSLGQQNLVAKVDVEQNRTQADVDAANAEAAQAAILASEAAVRKLSDEKSWANVTAPFDGVITSRSIDVGALLSQGNTTPLYTIAATDPVRVFVQVPQSAAPSIRPDLDVSITAREYPGRTFTGKVTRSAGALDPSLRTLNTEVRVPNPDGALLPGMYVQADIALPTPHRTLEIPSTALYNDADGLRVAAVVDGKIHFDKVTIERDTGATIQIATGITGDEQLVKIAVPSLVEGQAVEVSAPATSPAGAGSGSGSAAASGAGSSTAKPR